MSFLWLLPVPYRVGVLLTFCASLYLVGWFNGRSHTESKWRAQVAAIAVAEASAVQARIADNTKLVKQQAADNAVITKAHDEELADVRARLAAASRMRVPSFCRPAAATTEAASTSGSNGTDPASGLLPRRVDEVFRALVLQTEEVASTARSCQAFLTANGLAP